MVPRTGSVNGMFALSVAFPQLKEEGCWPGEGKVTWHLEPGSWSVPGEGAQVLGWLDLNLGGRPVERPGKTIGLVWRLGQS